MAIHRYAIQLVRIILYFHLLHSSVRGKSLKSLMSTVASSSKDPLLIQHDQLEIDQQPPKIDNFYYNIGFNSSQNESTTSAPRLHLNQNLLKQLHEQIMLLQSVTYRNERIYYGIAYCIIIISSFFGNLLVCKIFYKKRTKTNALILSLAASDLLMTIFNIPFNFFRIANFSWPFGDVMCFVVNFIQHLVVYISSYTMAIIAIQRYLNVTRFRAYETNHNQISNLGHNDVDNNNDNINININNNPNASNCFQHCINFCLVPFRYLNRTRFSKKNDGFSTKTIYITIIITWCCSAMLSLLFTYSSTVVIKKDGSYLLEVLIRDMFINNDTMNENKPAGFVDSTSHSQNNLNESDYLNYFLQDQPHSSNQIVRCRNPITENVRTFFNENFSIEADFFKTITIFVTQYFIPLSIICFLYVEIGKIIYQQGKLCNSRGNAKARIRQRRKLRRMLMLILMVAVFAFCWLPLHIFHILTDAGLIHFNYQIFMMVHWLAMSSVSYNPFIYCWLNKSFRKAALAIFCCTKIQNIKSNRSGEEFSPNHSAIPLNLEQQEDQYKNQKIFEQIFGFFRHSKKNSSVKQGCTNKNQQDSMMSQYSLVQTSNFILDLSENMDAEKIELNHFKSNEQNIKIAECNNIKNNKNGDDDDDDGDGDGSVDDDDDNDDDNKIQCSNDQKMLTILKESSPLIKNYSKFQIDCI